MARSTSLLTSCLFLALAACSSDPATGGTTSGGTTSGGSACDAKRDECAVNQKVCVEGKDGAEPTCEACPVGQYAAPSGSCAAIEGTPLSHDFADFSTKPGEEVLGLCQSWTLGNVTELWVSAVELVQDEASHHSNWLFAPDDQYPGPDGVWNCEDRMYTQTATAISGGVLYAQSTQAAKEVQHFPEGAAVRIPPYSKIIGDVHLLNTTMSEVKGHARLTLYTLDPSAVKIKLAPFHVTYEKLDIPPHATSRFYSDCQLDTKFQGIAKSPFDMKIYYVLPHTHALGTRFFLQLSGGKNDGQTILDVNGFNSEARGRAYDPPVDTTGATGLRFGCEFDNPRDVDVHWGFGDQEMCEALGFAESPVAFESRVSEVTPDGTDGPIPVFTGACNTLAFKWDQNKPGGTKP
ncbi:MAG: hypothetical protein U0359_30370 [Byssovorax sp.]